MGTVDPHRAYLDYRDVLKIFTLGVAETQFESQIYVTRFSSIPHCRISEIAF